MKYKKRHFSTSLVRLYGDERYIDHITVGRAYWYCWGSETDVYRHTKKHWNKIIVTYIRSGVVFYFLPEFPDYPEQYFPTNCFMAMNLEYAEFNPVKDLDWTAFTNDDEYTKEDLEKRYCFDDERTQVIDWDNSREGEIDDNDLDLFDLLHVKGITLV